MKIVEYQLFPEAFGSNGSFMTKRGIVAELIIDTGMLLLDYYKVIPSRYELNRLLLTGSYPRAGEWQPLELDEDEYMKVVKYLTELPLSKPYRVNEPHVY